MMSIRALSVGLTAAIVLVAVSHAALPPGPGRALPDVQIPAPGNTKIDLKQYRGKPLILALISAGCPHCVKTIEIMTQVNKEMKGRGLQMIAAAADSGDAAGVSSFVARYRPGFPVGYIDPPIFMKLANIGKDVRPTVPTMLFVDAKGMIRVQYFGDHPDMTNPEPTIRRLAEDLLKDAGAPVLNLKK
jgi:thiol-disulfide isomerase/thioredoxin